MGLRDRLRGIANRRIDPDRLGYKLFFALARRAARLGLIRPSDRIEVVHGAAGDLVLIPLAGSSSVRRKMRDRLGARPRPGQPLAVLTRDDGLRAQSFYNKKVANADTFGKALLLAHCGALTPQSDIETFLRWLETLPPGAAVDKHLWPISRILRHLGHVGPAADELNIAQDTGKIAALCGRELGAAVNRTEDVASYRKAQRFDEAQLERARVALARLS